MTAGATSAAPAKAGPVARVLIALVRFYQRLVSPVLHAVAGGGCRFHPTCSAYAVEVIRKDGALRGTVRAIGRLLRCHPLHPGGFDPP
jgi:putative membrane protein insertion efficiency factor